MILCDMSLMSTHNVCFYGEMQKNISKLSSNTHIICFSGCILNEMSYEVGYMDETTNTGLATINLKQG